MIMLRKMLFHNMLRLLQNSKSDDGSFHERLHSGETWLVSPIARHLGLSDLHLTPASLPFCKANWEATMSDLILSLVATGPPDYPRFIIADPDSKFWTGDEWSDNESEARLFVSVNDAGRAIQEILLAQHGHKPMRRFVAAVSVDLYADTHLSLDEITDWLVKVARLTIDSQTHGNGPVAGTLGLCQIDWSKLREIRSADD